MQVPLLDLKAQFDNLRDEIMPVVEEVIESQRYINGPAISELETLVAEYSETQAAVGVSSGTDALLCALMTLGIGPGDEVITTPFTFFASVGSIWRTGARPVFVDIQPDTFNMDPAKIAEKITGNTRAIMPIHLFGQMAEMDPILEIAADHDLFVVEDAAQAIGATYEGRKAGSLGTAGCFSFFPSKNLGAMGDGGMITTQDADLAEALAQTRNHGARTKYYHDWVGGNFRLDAIQAAVLIVKLHHLDGWSAERRRNAARYNELLGDVEELVLPTIRPRNVSIYNQYVVRAKNRDALQAHLKTQNIGTAIYYPLSLHEQTCFESLGYEKGDFPVSETAADEVLALPVYPELTDEQQTYVADQIKAFYAKS